jgi:hypothetical protein
MAQDYIMRLIEQVARMLAGILALRKAGQNEEARQEIDSSCCQTVGMSLEQIRRASPQNIAQSLERSGPARHARAIVLAELLLQDAELSEIAGRLEDALLSRLHVFCLLLDSIDLLDRQDQKIYSEKLDVVAAKLSPLSQDPFIAERMRQYIDRREEFGASAALQPSGVPA